MAGGGILLALCLGGAASGSDATAADTAASLAGPGQLGLLLVAVMPLALGLFVWRRWYDLGAAPRWSPAFSPPMAAGMFLAMFLLGTGGAEFVAHLLGVGPDGRDPADLALSDHALMLAGHAAGQAIVLAAFAWCSRPTWARSRPGPVRAMLAGAGAYLLVWPMVAATAFASGLVAERVTGQPVEPIAHDTLQVLVESPPDGWLVLMAGIVVLAVPVLEEVMYRGILQRTLVEVARGRWVAIVMTSAMFTAMHLGTARGHALPALFVLSLGFGWIYEKTGRLSACIVMHVLFNAVNLSLAWLSTPAA
ncbi:MAG: lysostaphin resistance A-like protein [Planctomycetota bacterium]|jgi:membrane protease YdiL (CAAX protease family)